VPKSASAATDLDLISYLRSIPDARMRRGVRFPALYVLLVAVLGILSGCQSLRDLERFAIRHHSVLTVALGIELARPPSDSSFRYFFHQVDVAALCAAIRGLCQPLELQAGPTADRSWPGTIYHYSLARSGYDNDTNLHCATGKSCDQSLRVMQKIPTQRFSKT